MKIAFSLWQFCGYLITLSYEGIGYRTGFIFYFFECLFRSFTSFDLLIHLNILVTFGFKIRSTMQSLAMLLCP